MNNHAPHLVYTLKGILTGAENWGDIFRRWCVQHAPRLIVEEIDWGMIGPVRMYASRALPVLNWRRQDAIAAFIRRTQAEYGNPPFSIGAFSFGTFLAHGTMWRHADIRPRSVFLFGSVLPSLWSRTRFPQMFARGQIGRLLNVWSPNDSAIRFGSFWPFGKAGSEGFRGIGASCPVMQCRTEEEHSSYFWKEFRDVHFQRVAEFLWEPKPAEARA